MRTFRTLEELIEFVCDQENIETLDNGEVTVKDWSEDFKALQRYWKEYGQTTSDKKAWDIQKEELAQKVAELTEKLDSAHDELARLKEINCGDGKEMLQRLNADIAAIKAKNGLLEKQVATIPDLKKKVDEWNSSRIVAVAKKAAAHYKVPQNIIDDPDFEKVVVYDLTIDDRATMDSGIQTVGKKSQRNQVKHRIEKTIIPVTITPCDVFRRWQGDCRVCQRTVLETLPCTFQPEHRPAAL